MLEWSKKLNKAFEIGPVRLIKEADIFVFVWKKLWLSCAFSGTGELFLF